MEFGFSVLEILFIYLFLFKKKSLVFAFAVTVCRYSALLIQASWRLVK